MVGVRTRDGPAYLATTSFLLLLVALPPSVSVVLALIVCDAYADLDQLPEFIHGPLSHRPRMMDPLVREISSGQTGPSSSSWSPVSVTTESCLLSRNRLCLLYQEGDKEGE